MTTPPETPEVAPPEVVTHPTAKKPSRMRPCPFCGEGLLPSAFRCPACGSPPEALPIQPSPSDSPQILRTEAQAPLEAGAPLTEPDIASPSAEPEPPAPTLVPVRAEMEISEPRDPASPPAAPWQRGLGSPQGLVNGAGRINGLLDHRGFINGSTLSHVRVRPRTPPSRYAALALGLLFLGLGTQNLLTGDEAGSGFALDGRFEDWIAAGVTAFTAVDGETDSADLALRSYAVYEARRHLLFWAEVEGTFFSDPEDLDTLHIFLDADGDPRTGYRYLGLGADYRLSVTGGGLAVESAMLSAFRGQDPEDYARWRGLFTPDLGFSGRALEIQVLQASLEGFTSDFTAAFLLEGNDGRWSASSLVVGRAPAAIRADLVADGPAAEVGARVATLTLTLEGEGTAEVTAISIRVAPSGTVNLSGLPASLSPQTSRVAVGITLVGTGAGAGEAISLEVVDLVASVPVTFGNASLSLYFETPSLVKRVDGLFADWAGVSAGSGTSPTNPDVDLVAHAGSAEGGAFFAYARVRGLALRGGRVPEFERRQPLSSDSGLSQAPSGPAPANRAEDRLVILVDEDPGAGTGAGIDFGADWRLEVFGRHGRALRTEVSSWAAGTWTLLSIFVEVEAAGPEVELRVPIPVPATAEMVMDLRDWRGTGETTQAFSTRGTRGEPSPRTRASSAPSWPGSWTSAGTDPDEGLTDTTLELIEVQFSSATEYLYLRMIVEGSTPVLTENTWWLYLDLTGDGQNDWLVEERPDGSGGVCSFQWDTGNGDWGTGSGCDVTDSVTDSDTGSAVRTVSSCSGSNGCVDFALEKSDYAGLGTNPRTTGAADAVEDLNLLGDTNRNPTDTGPGACDVGAFDDCTAPMAIPEFPTALVALAVLLLAWRRRFPKESPV